ncbi:MULTISPECIES: SPOR domain-containing protein [unclassified Mesorhizobium]|uniref:SPOR domain-containing protein n=1 Tax=unclassified Mesorhizobium TaxID=325217 RepID=UPI001091D453|nr:MULTISPECIES: SPOR domain-containing protein [unclassified Mesorhizobium]TGP89042.1 SPOR domain-containing protein [Mesorhizobium sp. M8A.F.Ca.ET.218.01.1.1]TGS47917.1 SPOR domain-containing protein [Mesorhizobium sp. M8A.F.Ca.ET.182.01.1.1]TGS83793.1 SPOR domain-containing protein [Mesorhizobium sp. M8A.F.Ca.ET.181.01.1.1]TGT16203.1 SPOR domain-containing protein [Mesorhizobium sp. M8A.F.Ca.ET.213.01.1.1]
MADRTQLRAADNNDIADDDPFAELTRIMGFDPRQPVKPQAPAEPKAAVADPSAGEGDFDIDLEKELMGEFDAADSVAAPVVAAHEPAVEPVAVDVADDDLALSLDDDFHLDMSDADDQAVAASHATAGAAQAVPSVEPAFDADFDNAVASSLEDISPFDDDLPMEDELAASLDQDFHIEDEAAEARHAVESPVAEVPVAVEPASNHEFDDAVAISLEDELMLDDHPADQRQAAAVDYPEPVLAAADETQVISDEDFAGHFDDAMPDVDVDFDVQADEPEAFDDEPAHELRADAVETQDEIPGAEAVSDDAFDLNLDEAFAEPAEEPVAEIAAASPQSAAPAAAIVPPVQAPIADERSLEDELNALLGAMTARTLPSAKEPAMVQPAVTQPAATQPTAAPVQPPLAATTKIAEQPVDLVGDLDWDLDETASEDAHQSGSAQAADANLDDLLLDELQDQDFGPDAAEQGDVDLDNDAFDAALAKSIGSRDETASRPDQADSLDWLAERSGASESARSWSRVTPVPQQPAFAAQPAPSMAARMAAPEVATVPSYRSAEPVAAAPYMAPVSAPQAGQSSHYEEMPDVETVDVPERVVALADDLDIPELHFEEDEPAAAVYDDLDAEFASLLTEMNSVEVAPATAGNAAYADESYNTGFNKGYGAANPGYGAANPGYGEVNPGYDGVNPGYEEPRQAYQPEARTYAARPAEMPARASASGYADAAEGFDLDNLPGSQPVSQADDFAVDELDYDPELDEAMSVPGLGEREAARPSGRRGLFIAAIVGAVAVAGGLGAFALSLGGKGGSEAPVIVKADNSPIKVKPENPGGTVVPNQDNKVYDAVVKGAKPAEPVQQKLVTNTEEPVDVQAKDPARAVNLSPDQNAAAGTDGGGEVSTAGAAPADNAAPAPKSEDRIAQVLQDADKGTNNDVVAVAPRKVRTMVVKSDGSLVAREDPAPAAPQVAAAEPTDPAPQHVAPAGADQTGADQTGADQTGANETGTDQTGTVAPAAAQADDEPALKPAAKPAKAEAKAQSANTPAKVAIAPQRPSDQPVDVVGEVKPDQVASIDPASTATGSGAWSIQIASQPTVDSAQSTYQDLQRRYGSVLSGRTANIVKAEIAGKGTFYRVRVPAQSRNDAINLCTSYKAAGGNCFVSR